MNFYASREYLDAAASVYFKGRSTAIEDVQFGEDVLRLLVVDGRDVETRLQFLDYHQPISEAERIGPLREGRYAQDVARSAIEIGQWDKKKFPRFELAPYVDWQAFRSFDEYNALLLERHRGSARDRERRCRRLAADHGELVFTVNDLGDDVLPFARHWKSRQLRETGHDDYFEQPQTMEFLTVLRERKLLTSSTLRAAGRLVSLWIGFIYDGCWSGWIFTYDPDFRKYSAGHQLLYRMLEASYRLGHREFDFSIGDEDYKNVYATHGRLLGAIGTPPLGRSIVDFAKYELKRRSPELLLAVRRLKKSVKGAVAANSAMRNADVRQ